MAVSVGTSGWSYRDWRGLVYPRQLPARDQLRWYAQRFPTVELNASFYRLPTPETFAHWRDETPPSFVFSVKMSRYVTHIRRLRDVDEGLDRFWRAASRLGDKLGPVLIQLPPTLACDEATLQRFLGLLPHKMRAAFEFRHRTWDTDRVRALLDDAGAAWVLADHPGGRVPLHVTGGWSYVRFHQGRRDEAGYPRSKLRRWAAQLQDLPVDDLFVYFNNDPGGAAIRDAKTFTELADARGLPVHRAAQSLIGAEGSRGRSVASAASVS